MATNSTTSSPDRPLVGSEYLIHLTSKTHDGAANIVFASEVAVAHSGPNSQDGGERGNIHDGCLSPGNIAASIADLMGRHYLLNATVAVESENATGGDGGADQMPFFRFHARMRCCLWL